MSTAPQQPGRRRSPTSLMLALEPRLMFDAAAIASVDDTLAAAAHAGDATAHAGDAPAVAPTDPAAAGTANRAAAAAGTATVTPAAPAPAPAPADTAPALLAPAARSTDPASTVTPPAAARHEIAFVDTALADWQTLAAGLRSDVEVIAIDGNRDGYAQMAAALAGRSGLDAIHILSHGSAG